MSTFKDNETPIIVLGMHRSGTSLLAGALYNLGIFMGEDQNLMPAQEDVNAKGFWEHEGIVAIHDEIYRVLGSHWSQIAALPDGWVDYEQIAPFRSELLKIITTEFFGKGLWGFKDPRVCRLLPLWHSIFAELGVRPKFILLSRHPFEVAASLTKRDSDLSWGYSLFLWLRHTLEAEEYSKSFDRSWLTYEALNQDWRTEIKRVGQDLNIEWPLSPDSVEVMSEMQELITDGLWHNRAAELIANHTDEWGCTLDLYDTLTEAASENPDSDSLVKRVDAVRRKSKPIANLVDEAYRALQSLYLNQHEILTKLQGENHLLVEQREDFASLNKQLQEENHLLVEQREDFASLNKQLQEENHLLVEQREALARQLNSGLIGFIHRLRK